MTQRTTVRAAICIAALLATLCGCGGGSDAVSSTPSNPGGNGSGGSSTPTPETIATYLGVQTTPLVSLEKVQAAYCSHVSRAMRWRCARSDTMRSVMRGSFPEQGFVVACNSCVQTG